MVLFVDVVEKDVDGECRKLALQALMLIEKAVKQVTLSASQVIYEYMKNIIMINMLKIYYNPCHFGIRKVKL